MQIRYIRDWQNGRTVNGAPGSNCDWREIKAIDYFGNNIALNKTVNFSHQMNGNSSSVVDNNFSSSTWTNANPGTKKSCTVDLGSVYDIDKLVIARASYPAICKETKTEVSANNITWYTIFDSATSGTYQETETGKEFKLSFQKLDVNSSFKNVIDRFDIHVNTYESQKTELKKILKSKGVNALDTDKMSDIIQKTNEISALNNSLPSWSQDGAISILEQLSANHFSFKGDSYGEKIYIYGGHSTMYRYTDSFRCIDVSNATITSLANGKRGLIDFGCNALDGKLYVIGGNNGSGTVYYNSMYNISSKTWSDKRNIDAGRENFGSEAIGSIIHCVGGKYSSTTYSDVAQDYNTTTDTWTTRRTYPSYVSHPSTVMYKGKMYIFGGRNGNTYYGYSYRYNHDTDTYTTLATAPKGFSDKTCVLYKDCAYFVGGTFNSSSDNSIVLKYDFIKNKWDEIKIKNSLLNANGIVSCNINSIPFLIFKLNDYYINLGTLIVN